MSGLGFVELGAIFLLILILFGPQEMPKLARFVAKLIYEMKNIFQRLAEEWNLENHGDNSSVKKPNKLLSDVGADSDHIQYSESQTGRKNNN